MNVEDARKWEPLADRLHAAGWSWGHVTMVNESKNLIHVADAHRDDGHRYVAHGATKEDAFEALIASLPTTAQNNPRKIDGQT